MALTLVSVSAKVPTAKAPKISDYVQGTDKLPTESQSSLVAPIRAFSNDLREYLSEVAVKYGQDYKVMEAVVMGESSFNQNAIGDDGLSVGIGQYTLPTWLENCSDKDERLDPYKSLDCMGKMFQKGMQSRWTVWRNLYGK